MNQSVMEIQRKTKIEAMPLRRTAVRRRVSVTRAPRSRARVIPVTTRRDSWRSHVHRTSTAQRMQSFKPQACNVNFLWVGLREGYLFSKKRYPSLVRAAPSALPSLPPREGIKRVFSFAKENTPFAWQWRSAPHDQCSAARCTPRPSKEESKKRTLSRIERRSLLLASVNLTDTSACRRWRGRGRRRRRS